MTLTQRIRGQVVRVEGPAFRVRGPDGTEWQGVVRGRLKKGKRRATAPVCIGDEVEVTPLPELVAFIGPSGTGKTSLLNALCPGLDLRTGQVDARGRGRHTRLPLPGLLPRARAGLRGQGRRGTWPTGRGPIP